MTNDTAFAGGVTEQGPAFDPIYDNYQDAPVKDAKTLEDAVPRGIYLVEFEAGKGQFSKAKQGEEPLPLLRVPAKILLGIEGTIGRKIFGNLTYATSKYGMVANAQGVQVRTLLTRDEWIAAGQKDVDTLKRVATVLGFFNGLPSRPHTVETLNQFGQQFAGKRAVIEVGLRAATDDFDASNFVMWAYIRTENEIVRTSSGEVVGTAIDYARKKIAAAESRAAKRKAKANTTDVQRPVASAGDFS